LKQLQESFLKAVNNHAYPPHTLKVELEGQLTLGPELILQNIKWKPRTHLIQRLFLVNIIRKWALESQQTKLKKLLQFMTGKSRFSHRWFQENRLRVVMITIHEHEHRLPSARTCHLQLDLPKYRTEEMMEERVSIRNSFMS
jgi:hypothetical protein